MLLPCTKEFMKPLPATPNVNVCIPDTSQCLPPSSMNMSSNFCVILVTGHQIQNIKTDQFKIALIYSDYMPPLIIKENMQEPAQKPEIVQSANSLMQQRAISCWNRHGRRWKALEMFLVARKLLIGHSTLFMYVTEPYFSVRVHWAESARDYNDDDDDNDDCHRIFIIIRMCSILLYRLPLIPMSRSCVACTTTVNLTVWSAWLIAQ